MLRCGLPNNAYDIASSIVDLPAPFDPTTRVAESLFNGITVGVLPVERKFWYDIDSNISII